MPFGSGRRGQRRGDAGEQPALVEQEPQAQGGEDDEQRLGVGVGQDERAGEHGEQHHRPLGDVGVEEPPGEDADEHDGADRRARS